MKFIFGFLLIALFSNVGLANVTFDQEYVLNHDGIGYHKAQLGTLLMKTKGLLVAKYSYAVQGGSTSSLLTNLGFPRSYAVLPAGAIITNVWIETLTQPTSGGSATIAIKAESAADLLAATAVTSLPVAFKQGVPTGATTTFVKTTAARTITASVAVATLTAGKFNVFIEYVLSN